MAGIEQFETHAAKYEDWFEKNPFAYESELQAVRMQIPIGGKGIEIGVGSGRFAEPLGINLGIEPSGKMREIAEKRGIKVMDGVAENLPFDNAQFDFALMVTTICFLDDIKTAFKEAHRILKPGGSLIIGFVDKNSPIGKSYQEHKNESTFYQEATFYSVDEVIAHLRDTGFTNFNITQTIFHDLKDIKSIEPIKKDYGEGSFVVIRATG